MDKGDQPLLWLKPSGVVSYRPDSLAVFEDGIVVKNASSLVGVDVHQVRYDQIARVSVRYGLFFADLIVETRGGDTLLVRGVPMQGAERASIVIRERMGSGPAKGTEEPATVYVTDQIRKLAELRDLGAITEEEFQAKKRDLLGRI